MTQTHLEQVNANREFREIVDYLGSIRYLHLVPQLIREPDRGSDRSDDPTVPTSCSRWPRLPCGHVLVACTGSANL